MKWEKGRCIKSGVKDYTKGKVSSILNMNSSKFLCSIIFLVLIFAVGNNAMCRVVYAEGSTTIGEYTPSTFPYNYENKAKKYINLYEEALENKSEFVYVEKVSLSLNEKYKQTLDSSDFTYYGEIKDGKPSGAGVLFWHGSVYYMGNFKNGMFSGFGIYYGSSVVSYNIEYEGNWSKGNKSGEGILYDTVANVSEIIYEGNFKNDVYSGKGELYDCDSNNNIYLLYEGSFKKGKYSGSGKLYYSDGTLKYNGKFKNGEYNGKGKLYNADGTLKYEGKFKNGDVA